MKPLIENVEEGRVPISQIDRAVRRILRQKIRLGLFERPLVDPERAVKIVHSSPHQELAWQAGRESIVLLKNEKNLLPLAKSVRSIAVIGPNANHKLNLLGDYVSKVVLQDVVTVLEGIKTKAGPSTKVIYAKGCDVLGADRSGFEEARNAAKAAEVAIVVVGENERRAAHNQGTNGEGKDVASLDLTGVQEDLIRAVHETGTPTVVVLVNGRPLSTRWTAENVPALVEAWLPGEKGGLAVADVLFGDYNPGGRLPVSIPRHVGQLPVYYNYKPSKLRWHYLDMTADPLYPFGYGLSYTRFEYSNLRIAPQKLHAAGNVQVRVDVANAGDRAGEEVVQLYLNDPIATVSRPVKELRGFRKIPLQSGEKKTVEFTLTPEDFSLLNRNLESIIEPGEFRVMVGRSSADICLEGKFEVVE
jgi:beta-glucosidase